MSDDRPSIAELQQLNGIVCDGSRPDYITHAAQAVLARWQPVLLEIAAAALASRRPIETEQDARDSFAACRALDAALAKVRS